MNIQYYLIHGVDGNRKDHMLQSFKRVNIDNDKVKWMLSPNKDQITDEIISQFVAPGITHTCGIAINAQNELSKGKISCTYKHFLCIEDIVKNNYEYGVIMEDNMYLIDDVPKILDIYIQQLNKMYPDWDILFDCGWQDPPVRYIEQPLIEGQIVYAKTNEITNQCHGGTKCAQFYLINLKCAKKLYENFLPFNNAPDWWMNDLFRKLNIKSFWAEPSNVGYWQHTSTA